MGFVQLLTLKDTVKLLSKVLSKLLSRGYASHTLSSFLKDSAWVTSWELEGDQFKVKRKSHFKTFRLLILKDIHDLGP